MIRRCMSQESKLTGGPWNPPAGLRGSLETHFIVCVWEKPHCTWPAEATCFWPFLFRPPPPGVAGRPPGLSAVASQVSTGTGELFWASQSDLLWPIRKPVHPPGKWSRYCSAGFQVSLSDMLSVQSKFCHSKVLLKQKPDSEIWKCSPLSYGEPVKGGHVHSQRVPHLGCPVG